MNIQSLIKQAQSMQKNMQSAKTKIDTTIFEGNSELVSIKMNGKRKIIEVKIKLEDKIENDDIEMLEDMIMIAVNDATSKIEKEINNKLGSQAGMFGDLL